MKKLFVTMTVLTLLSSMSVFAGELGTEMHGGEICNSNGKTGDSLINGNTKNSNEEAIEGGATVLES